MLILNIEKKDLGTEDKNKYANQLNKILKNKEWELYFNFLNSNLPPHKVWYIPREINKKIFFFNIYGILTWLKKKTTNTKLLLLIMLNMKNLENN